MKTNQKPIEYDIHLKYICKKCSQQHWLSFLEASTKGFKIVCLCGNVFGVKRVEKFKIKYVDQTKPVVNNKLLDSCVQVLTGYGYSDEESKSAVKDAFKKSSSQKLSDIVKISLVILGEKNGI